MNPLRVKICPPKVWFHSIVLVYLISTRFIKCPMNVSLCVIYTCVCLCSNSKHTYRDEH